MLLLEHDQLPAERSGVQHFPRSLGVPRREMPQIKLAVRDEFFARLRARGVEVERREVQARRLHPTQKEINWDLAAETAGQIRREGFSFPIIVARDFYILDGHHRWAAQYLADMEARIPSYVIDLGIRDLLKAARDFEGTTYEMHALLADLRVLTELSFPGDCTQKRLRRAVRRVGAELRSGGNHDTVVSGSRVITQIPRHDPSPGTCRAILKALDAFDAEDGVDDI